MKIIFEGTEEQIKNLKLLVEYGSNDLPKIRNDYQKDTKTTTGKVKYICKHCGGDNILYDAYAEWNIEKQEFELASTFDYAYCPECDGETTPVQSWVQEKMESTKTIQS